MSPVPGTTRRSPAKLWQLAALAGAVTLALVACSGQDNGVASLGNQSDQGAERQIQTARAMVQCLVDAGVPAKVTDLGNGGADIGLITNDQFSLMYADLRHSETGGEPIFEGDPIMAIWDGFDALYRNEDGSWSQSTLYIGQSDHSAAFAQCLVQTGFSPPSAPQRGPAEELREKQQQVQAGAAWAACAREHGYPGINDPDPPVADDWDTWPEVVLPGTITEAELRALLAACPNFDKAAHAAADAAALQPDANTAELEWPVDPTISFAAPDDLDWDNEDAPEVKRLMALYEILAAEENAYYAELAG